MVEHNKEYNFYNLKEEEIYNSNIGLHYSDDKVENGLDLLKTIYKKQNKKGVNIVVLEVQKYVGLGQHPPHTGYYSQGLHIPYESSENLKFLDDKK